MDMTDMTRAAVSRRHFLQLAGAGMLALTGTALTGCGNSTSGEGELPPISWTREMGGFLCVST